MNSCSRHAPLAEWLLATVVESELKAPFSIATTPRCRGGSYSFPWIAPLYLDTYLIMQSVNQGGIKYLLSVKSFGWLDLGLNPGLPDHWWALYLLDLWAVLGFNPRSNHIKDTKMVLDTSFLNTQHYKVCIKGKVELFKEEFSGHRRQQSPTLLIYRQRQRQREREGVDRED